jgi:CHAD domain-containing protein
MAYEQLQKKLEDIQKQIKDSRTEIGKWKDAGVKQKNVQQHIESLTEGKIAFKWD